jgi:hypothetical protein
VVSIKRSLNPGTCGHPLPSKVSRIHSFGPGPRPEVLIITLPVIDPLS